MALWRAARQGAMTYGMRAPAMSLKESNTYWLGGVLS